MGEFGNGSAWLWRRRSPEHTTVRGKVTYPGNEHLTVEMAIERIEPQRYFSCRLRPHAVKAKLRLLG